MRAWAALAIAGVLALGLYQLRAQARQIESLQADNTVQRQAVEQLGHALDAQHKHHERQLAARDAAIEAHRHEAEQAAARAVDLSAQFEQARSADALIDSCLGLMLPRGIAERLRE